MKRLIIYSSIVFVVCQLILVSCDSGDMVKPELTLTGNEDTTLILNSAWKEPGYKAVDDMDGIITSSVVVKSNVNKDSVGVYQISYSVADAAGNRVAKKRIVNVQNAAYRRAGLYSASIQFTDYLSNTTSTPLVEKISCSKTQNNVIFFENFGAHNNCVVKGVISGLTLSIPQQSIFLNGSFTTFSSISPGTIVDSTLTIYYKETDVSSNVGNGIAIYSKN